MGKDKLNTGVYETVISKDLNQEIEKSIEELHLYKEDLDVTEASGLISSYLALVMKKGLNYYKKNKGDILKQIAIANAIIEKFGEEIEDQEFNEYQIQGDQLLKGIYTSEVPKNILPVTPMSKPALFTGNSSEPTVYSELNKEIATADAVDLLVSFIKFSGLRLILPALREHTKTKPLRIITTSYMGATDYKAIEELAKLPNTTVKISYDTERTRLHAKAYYFYRKTGFSTAYIGSSNMSKAALTEGTEWNLKLSEYSTKEIIEKYRMTFESYWNSDDFRRFNPDLEEDKAMLKTSLKRATSDNGITYGFDIRPYDYQQEILDKLEVERDVLGSKRNLVVAATGTGKTIVAALDFKRYYKDHPNCKLLFLAHRKEILEQSLATFRGVLKDQNFGQLWVGGETPLEYDHVFASVQTLSSGEKYRDFEPEYFDFCILDETHHGSASSYDTLLTYFTPDLLLGLTATPERMDGEDITKYFNHKIAYEIRLHEAINRRLLCPFHYFGVTDSEDISQVPFVRGKYDAKALSNVYTGNDKRATNILKAVHTYSTDMENIKGVGFCASIEHANFMANFFNNNGIPSMSLNAESNNNERESGRQKLMKGQVQFVFVVDLYNEGVDIPAINTVLFLRPTESSTVFIQQLGRGLRIDEDKEVLTVLDFVGQANEKYNYRNKLTSLIGRTHNSLEKEIENNFSTLPKGCYISLERVASQHILANLKASYVNKRNLLRMIGNFKFESTRKLTLANFIKHYQLEPYQIYSNYSFYQLLSIEGLCDGYDETKSKSFNSILKRVMHVDSMLMIDFFLNFMENMSQDRVWSKEEEMLLLMWHYTFSQEAPEEEPLELFREEKKNHPLLFKEIEELLTYNRNQLWVKEKSIDLNYEIPLELYAKYSVDQILAAMEVHTKTKKVPFREGVKYVEGKKTDLLFITLNKSEKHFSETTMYEDYAISPYQFHWQSQSRTSVESTTGQRYIHQRKNGTTVLLFVREQKNEHGITTPYCFLGKAGFMSYEGSKPISIIWELEEPMPTGIYKKNNYDVG